MGIPILLYHRLLGRDKLNDEKYEIPAEVFEKHIRYLSANGFQTLSLPDISRNKHHALSKTKKSVIISFDDGSYSDYSIAYPILKRYGFSATFFITVNWVETENFVGWTQLEEMARNGMSIQSHSLSHAFLCDIDDRGINRELHESMAAIKDKLKVNVEYLSIPGGFFTKKVLGVAKDAGYAGVCTSAPGMNSLKSDDDRFKVFNRFVITRRTAFDDFKAIVERDRGYEARCKAEYALKVVFKKLLGSAAYYAIWSRFFRKA